MAKVKKVFYIASNALIYLILAVVITTFVLILCGVKPFITMSGSMEPNIKTGSICFVNTRASFQDVEIGDVIVFENSSESLVTHRAIGIDNDGTAFVTKGDNNDVEDGPTTTVENFRGETLWSIPYVGYVLAAFQRPQYKIILGIVIAALFLFVVIDCFYKDTV